MAPLDFSKMTERQQVSYLLSGQDSDSKPTPKPKPVAVNVKSKPITERRPIPPAKATNSGRMAGTLTFANIIHWQVDKTTKPKSFINPDGDKRFKSMAAVERFVNGEKALVGDWESIETVISLHSNDSSSSTSSSSSSSSSTISKIGDVDEDEQENDENDENSSSEEESEESEESEK